MAACLLPSNTSKVIYLWLGRTILKMGLCVILLLANIPEAYGLHCSIHFEVMGLRKSGPQKAGSLDMHYGETTR